MLHAQAGKDSRKQLPAHPFFLRGLKLSLLPFPMPQPPLCSYGMQHVRDSGISAALSSPMLPVYLICVAFSAADVVESPTMHVEFNLFLPLPVLFQCIRQGIHSLRNNCLFLFFHPAHPA